MGNCQKEEDQIDDGVPRFGPIQQIRITNYVWTKDYQGLFDYQSTSIQKKTVKVSQDAFLSKQNSNIMIHFEKSTQMKEKTLKNTMFQMTKKQNFYQINPIYIEDENYTFQKMLWLVVKSVPQKVTLVIAQFYTLQQKDIIKLGKQKVRVRQLVPFDPNPSIAFNFDNIQVSRTIYDDLTIKPRKGSHQNPNSTKTFLKLNDPDNQAVSVITTSEQVCRICLESGQTTNPLITPCKCSGSVKYIHLKCLRMWLAKRLQSSKSNHCITINWQPLACQMCKSHFKYRIYMDNKKFYTVQIPKPPKPYVVLEVIRKNEGHKGRLFHFVSLAQKKKVSLGRRKDIDVRISDDISVSRNHASIQYKDDVNKFILTDNDSKFGSLILIKKSLLVKTFHPGISFQVGAEVFSCQVMRQKGGEQQKNISTNYLPDQVEDQEEEQVEENEESQNGDNNQQQMENSLVELQSPGVLNALSHQN